MQPDVLRREVDANYDFFERNLAMFLVEHAGQYALIRACEVIGFFDKPGDAYRAGLGHFPDEIFSIQEVIDEPIDLGFFSHVQH